MSVVYSKQYNTKCACTGDDSDMNVVLRLYWGCRRAQEGDRCEPSTVVALSKLAPVIMDPIWAGIITLNENYAGKINIHAKKVEGKVDPCITIVETTEQCTDDDLKCFMKSLNDIFKGIGTITIT